MPSFNPDTDIPDLSGKVILVTGANIGLGKEMVLQLSKRNPARIFLAARSEEKAIAAIEDIQRAAPNVAPITFLPLDLCSLESVKKAAASFLAQSDKLHLLINNAGIMATPPGTTQDGYEIQFGTNHMGHALLTRLLLPTLKATAASTSPPQDVRVVFLSSAGEALAPSAYPFDRLKSDMADYMTMKRYSFSKRANVHFAREVARRNPDIRSISVHPGLVQTNLGTTMITKWPILKYILMPLALVTEYPSTGVRNQLWAAVSPDAQSGEFYHPVGVPGKGSAGSKEDEPARALWDWTEKELEGYL